MFLVPTKHSPMSLESSDKNIQNLLDKGILHTIPL